MVFASTATALAAVGAAAAVAGAGVAAYGAVQQGEATSAADKYNAAMAANNAKIATQNANLAGAAGTAQVEQASLQTRAKAGGIMANQAAGGIDVSSGSALDVRSSAKDLGELNALTIRSNAARQAYGYQTQSASDTGQSQLDQSSATNASTAGDVKAGSTAIGGVGDAASNYSKFVQAGGGNSLTSGADGFTGSSSLTTGTGGLY
jgi:hypothetical protein